AFEGRPDHAFSLAVAIGGRHVGERNAAPDRATHRRNALLTRRGPPPLPPPAPSQSGRTHRPEPAPQSPFHDRPLGVASFDNGLPRCSALQGCVEKRDDRARARLGSCPALPPRSRPRRTCHCSPAARLQHASLIVALLCCSESPRFSLACRT